ncbi:GvpL/GvpF family gas vesicle protein [Streptomyces sp. HPF1205]|uniref:GvpL/GvpF family gas vesicle protein n=1 Tax=Streptomyces sp. HPF1205 TaxID=2873262 RepID=UPI001CEDE8E8|nr:GvpL/GvpF family gas vesicle protein [Streptomyces sp. HPF1205]
MTDLLYAYAVARPGRHEPSGLGTGVAGGRVRALADGDLAAFVSAVPAAGFGEAALRERLEDLRWLEETARAHHEVVARAAGGGCVLPLRLATVYRDEDGVRRMLRDGRAALGAALDRLDGRVEWGVKVYAVPAEAPGAPGPGGGAGAGAASGRDYLRQRLNARRTQDRGHEQAAGFAERLDARLSRYAEDRRLHRPQDARLSGASGVNVLNASYLLPAADAAAFAECARGGSGEGGPWIRVELTGPWAPYSFAALPPAAAGNPS